MHAGIDYTARVVGERKRAAKSLRRVAFTDVKVSFAFWAGEAMFLFSFERPSPLTMLALVVAKQ